MRRVVVVGAGLAGLSAAIRLADQGAQVTVLERKRVAGGRVRRIKPCRGHAGVDFGQHLMLGCYRESIDLARRLGSDHLLRRVEGNTPFLSGPEQIHSYRLGKLPAPLHMLPGLTGLTQLKKRDRLLLARVFAAAKVGLRWSPEDLDETDVSTWLARHGQSHRSIAGFWNPLVLATLNTPCREASAFLLATVLSKSFLSTRADAEPLLPSTTFHDLFVGPAIDAIERAGGRVLLGTDVERLVPGGPSEIEAVVTRDGELTEADAVILAVPSWCAVKMLAPLPLLGDMAPRLDALGSSPIVNVDLWFDREWMRYPYAGLLGSPVQWFFNHGSETDRGRERSGFRVSLVMSGAKEQISREQRALIDECLGEIKRYFPAAAEATLTGHLVTKARRATIRGRPGQRRLRPPSRTAYNNLLLAGDWTATDLPATIESAVASGRSAAETAAREIS